MRENKNTPFVVISLLNWMSYEDTMQCVRSIQQLSYSNFQIIIRDNASPNDSYEQLKKSFPDLRVERAVENRGFAAGHYENYLIAKELKADLFWILNSDLEVHPESLNALVDAYHKHGNHIYGSVSLNPAQQDLIDFGGAPYTEKSTTQLHYNSWKGRPLKELQTQHPELYEVESVEGSSMLIPMAIIEKCGFMKLDFFMYGEEVEYCYRCRKHDICSYLCTRSIIKHKNEGSLKSSENLRFVPIYYRKRNIIRLKKELFKMSIFKLYNEDDNIFVLLKSLIKGHLKKPKLDSYYFALAQIHGLVGIKGKIIKPEKLL
jgi:GT2 family glycosyltransferase